MRREASGHIDVFTIATGVADRVVSKTEPAQSGKGRRVGKRLGRPPIGAIAPHVVEAQRSREAEPVPGVALEWRLVAVAEDIALVLRHVCRRLRDDGAPRAPPLGQRACGLVDGRWQLAQEPHDALLCRDAGCVLRLGKGGEVARRARGGGHRPPKEGRVAPPCAESVADCATEVTLRPRDTSSANEVAIAWPPHASAASASPAASSPSFPLPLPLRPHPSRGRLPRPRHPRAAAPSLPRSVGART